MLLVACAMVLTAATVSAFANGVPRAVAGSMPAQSMPAQATAVEATKTWAPAGGAQVIDTGSDCAVTMGGTIHAPDLTAAQTLQTTLADLRGKATDVSKDGYHNLQLTYVSKPSLNGDYQITIQGNTVIDCSLARSSQAVTTVEPAAALTQDTPLTAAAGSNWKRGTLGAFAGIAAYLAVTVVVSAALAFVGVELATPFVVAAAATGCIAGLVGSTVALAVSGNKDKIGLASAAASCILGAGMAWVTPVADVSKAIGKAIQTLTTAAPGIIEAVGGQELVAAGEGIEMTSLGTAVGQAAEGALAVS